MNATAWPIYAIFVVGGAGLYLALPKANRSPRAAGLVVGLGALAGLLALLAGEWAVPGTYNGYFMLFAAVAMLSSARVVTHTKPVYSAVWFVLTVVAVAMIMVLQLAEFLAVALIIIYAGAILVTYVFVIMLAQQTETAGYDLRSREPFWAVFASFALTAAIAGQVSDMPSRVGNGATPVLASDRTPIPSADEAGHTVSIGRQLLTQYVVALEISGVLLLVAMVGAIVLARKKVPADPYALPESPPGRIGRQVEPF